MPEISFLQPLDQPFGGQRALEWVRDALVSGAFSAFRMVVAYAKEGELLRLKEAIEEFRKSGGNVQAVFGFDQRGTSRQALHFALLNFDEVRVWQHPSMLITFHPKMYLFVGTALGEAIVGSCNLTVGGLETNCESAVRLRYSLPVEAPGWKEAARGWEALLTHPNTSVLGAVLIAKLEAEGLLHDESVALAGTTGGKVPKYPPQPGSPLFPSTAFSPPSKRPSAEQPKVTERKPKKDQRAPVPRSLPVALLIQIDPHHNGEVFLSKRAVDQQEDFFGFPFTGLTTPKKKNPPYPQRVPDPITNWTVYNKVGKVKVAVPGYGLNTVYYEKKSEIRITVSPNLREAIPPYSILQMTKGEESTGVDYVCDVYPPDSPQYKRLLVACTQTMPSGGRGQARRFGWV